MSRLPDLPQGYETSVPLDAMKVDTPLLPPPGAPMKVARRFVADRYTHVTGRLVLRHWRGGWWHWQTSHWAEVEDRAILAAAYAHTEHADYQELDATGNVTVRAWSPNRHRIADLLDALRAVTHLAEQTNQPGWLDGTPSGVIVACANGLLNVHTRTIYPHDPAFWNQTAVPFAYDPDAPDPARWLGFLDELWPGDIESQQALQEFVGYIISGRLDL
jgi:putative DNA primase/helicase